MSLSWMHLQYKKCANVWTYMSKCNIPAPHLAALPTMLGRANQPNYYLYTFHLVFPTVTCHQHKFEMHQPKWIGTLIIGTALTLLFCKSRHVKVTKRERVREDRRIERKSYWTKNESRRPHCKQSGSLQLKQEGEGVEEDQERIGNGQTEKERSGGYNGDENEERMKIWALRSFMYIDTRDILSSVGQGTELESGSLKPDYLKYSRTALCTSRYQTRVCLTHVILNALSFTASSCRECWRECVTELVCDT